ncbi:MAG: fibrinogen-like YCDxxxxGGGW domain-containing protein [Bacteroidales bacterium]|nr:fibrinogen-like YCDxxxxGGGW domain-containing protein [Bacteroidales bacterium]
MKSRTLRLLLIIISLLFISNNYYANITDYRLSTDLFKTYPWVSDNTKVWYSPMLPPVTPITGVTINEGLGEVLSSEDLEVIVNPVTTDKLIYNWQVDNGSGFKPIKIFDMPMDDGWAIRGNRLRDYQDNVYAYKGINLVENGGFESGAGSSIDDWVNISPDGPFKGVVASDKNYKGDRALKFTSPCLNKAIKQTIAVEKNTEYIISAWVYKSSDADLFLDVEDIPEEVEAHSTKQGEWEYIESRFTTSATRTSVNFRVVIHKESGADDYWIDDVRFVKAKEVPEFKPYEGFDGKGCFEFDGKDDGIYVEDSDIVDLSNNFTISFWMNPLKIHGPEGSKAGVILRKGDAYELFYSNGKINLRIHTPHFNQNTIDYDVEVNRWSFVTVTFIDGVLKGYINGVLRSSNTYSGNVKANTNNLCFGRYNSGGYPFKGKLDEIKFFNRALSDNQIAVMYNDCLNQDGSYKGTFQDNVITSYETNSDEKWKVDVISNDNTSDGEPKTSNEVLITFPQITGVAINNGDTEAFSGGNLLQTTTPDFGNSVKVISDWQVSTDNGNTYNSIKVFDMPMDGNPMNGGTPARDYINGDNGTVKGAVYEIKAGVDGYGAYKFYNDDVIEIENSSVSGHPLDFVDDMEFTISVWFKPTHDSEGYILAKRDASNIQYGLLHTTDNKLMFLTTSGHNIATSAFEINKWYHGVVRVNSDRSVQVFLNGVLAASATGVGIEHKDINVAIGSRWQTYPQTHTQFEGYIDNLEVYNRALSDSQISVLYNNIIDEVSTEIIVAQEISPDEKWKVTVTPNDNVRDGDSKTSNEILIKFPQTNQVQVNSGDSEVYSNRKLEYTTTPDVEDKAKLITDWQIKKDAGSEFESIKIFDMPMDGGALASGKVKDYINSNNAELKNEVRYVSNGGFDGKGAYLFDGSNDYLQIDDPSDGSLELGTEDFTITFWIKWLKFPTVTTEIFQKEGSVHFWDIMFSTEYGGNNLRIEAGDRSRVERFETFTTSSPFSELNKWYNVVLTRNSQGVKFIVNGVDQPIFVKRTEFSTNLDVSAPLYIGKGGRGHVNAVIDEISIFKRALSVEQAKVMYNNYATTGIYRNDIFVPKETTTGERWKVEVTPNDNIGDGVTRLSNEIEIAAPFINSVVINNNNPTVTSSESVESTLLDAIPNDTKNIYEWQVDKNDGNGFQSIKVVDVPMDGGLMGDAVVKNYINDHNINLLSGKEPVYVANGGFDGNGAYSFNGAHGAYITEDEALHLANYTLSVWIKPTALGSDMNILSKNYYSNEQSGRNMNYSLAIMSNKDIRFQFENSSGTDAILDAGITVETDKWYHVVATYDQDSGIMNLFINGVLVGIKKTELIPEVDCTQDVRIGYSYSGNNVRFFKGNIDELKIYNRALSGAQIEIMYNNYTSTNREKESLLLAHETRGNDKWRVNVTPIDNSSFGESKTSNEVTVMSPSISNVVINSGVSTIKSSGVIKSQLNNDIPESSKHIYNWQIDKNDGNGFKSIKVVDVPMDGGFMGGSVVKNYMNTPDMTLKEGKEPVYNASGGFDGNGAFEFNGDNWVEIADDPQLKLKTYTISTWVKTSKTGEYQQIIAKERFSAEGYYNKNYSIYITSGDRIHFMVEEGIGPQGSPPKANIDSDITIEKDKWYHVVGVFDDENDRISLYINGELTASEETGITPCYQSTEPIRLGMTITTKDNQYHRFYGTIDELKIYNIALSGEQVKLMYNNYTTTNKDSEAAIVPQQTRAGEKWRVDVTPIDNFTFGDTKTSNEVTVTSVKSCEKYLSEGVVTNGVYDIDPDGDGGDDPFMVYCDMTTNGGGWTHIATIADDGNDYWTWNNRATYSNNEITGEFKSYGTHDYKSKAWATVSGRELMFMPANNNQKYLIYNTILDGGTMRSAYNPDIDAFANEEYNVYKNSGDWWYECDGLNMSLEREDSDGLPHKNNSRGFVWRSANSEGCNYDDSYGAISNSNSDTNKESYWGVDGFYNRNFDGTGMMIFVRNFDYTEFEAKKTCKDHYNEGRVNNGIYNIDPDGEGDIKPFEVYCDMSSTDLNQESESSSTSLKSCMEHLVLFPDNKNRDGIYSIDPDGVFGSKSAFKTHCDMTKDGGGWTRINPDIARNRLNGTITIKSTASISEFDSENRYRSRDGSDGHAIIYDIDVDFGFNQFYFDNYKAKAYCSSDKRSEIFPDEFKITDWNILFKSGRSGDIAFGSAHEAPITSFANNNVRVDCGDCEFGFPEDKVVYNLNNGSDRFRIGWGESGGTAEGWYPWYSGYIYVRESATKHYTAEKSCSAHKNRGRTNDGIYKIDPDGEGGIEPFEAYCDMTSTYFETSSESSNTALKSCLHHLLYYPDNAGKDGIYLLDIDGTAGTDTPFKATCDMTTEGGGWTRIFAINAKRDEVTDRQFWVYNIKYGSLGTRFELQDAFYKFKGFNNTLFKYGDEYKLTEEPVDPRYIDNSFGDMMNYYENGVGTSHGLVATAFRNSDFRIEAFDYPDLGLGCHYESLRVTDFNHKLITHSFNSVAIYYGLDYQKPGVYRVARSTYKELYQSSDAYDKNIDLLGRNLNSILEDLPAEKSCRQHYLKGRKIDGVYKIDPDGDGAIQPFKAYCDMTSNDLEASSESSNTALKSCMQHLIYYPENYRKDGIYLLDVDGAEGSVAPFKATCDMITEGGGWTRLFAFNPKKDLISGGNFWNSDTRYGAPGERLEFHDAFYHFNGFSESMVKAGEYTEISTSVNNRFQTYSVANLLKYYNGTSNDFNNDKLFNGSFGIISVWDYHRSTKWGHYYELINIEEHKSILADAGYSIPGIIIGADSRSQISYRSGLTSYANLYNSSRVHDVDFELYARDIDLTTAFPAEKSCMHHYLKNRKVDGVYKIDPDGDGAIAEFEAYCDMTTDEGGWTLVHKNDRGANQANDITDDGYNLAGLQSPDIDATAILPREVIEQLGNEFRLTTDSENHKAYWRFSSQNEVFYNTKPDVTDNDIACEMKVVSYDNEWKAATLKKTNNTDATHVRVEDAEMMHIIVRRDCCSPKGNFWFNYGSWHVANGLGSYHPGTVWVRDNNLSLPEISWFKANKNRINRGNEIQLSWEVPDGVTAEIYSDSDSNYQSGKDVSSSNNETLTPDSDKAFVTYILKVTNADGFTSEKEVTVFLNSDIPYSLRFNYSKSNYLKRKNDKSGNKKIWTFSTWIKLGKPNTEGNNRKSIFASGEKGQPTHGSALLYINNLGKLCFGASNDHQSVHASYESVEKIDNYNEWAHIFVSFNSTEVTEFDRFKAYLNGEELNLIAPYPVALNRELAIGKIDLTHTLGVYNRNCTSDNCPNINNTVLDTEGNNDYYPHFYDGYMTEIYFVDGYSLSINDFGEFKSGKWIPKATSVQDYGINGFYLNFHDQTNPGKDYSGNYNDMTIVNYNSNKDEDKYIDQMLDSPDRNFSVLSPQLIDGSYSSLTLHNGNLRTETENSGGQSVQIGCSYGDIGTGKWYIERTNITETEFGGSSNVGLSTKIISPEENMILYNKMQTNSGGDEGFYKSKGADKELLGAKLTGGVISYIVNTEEGEIKVNHNGSHMYQITDSDFVNEVTISMGSGSYSETVSEINFGQGGQSGLKNYKIDISTGVWTEVTDGSVPDVRFSYSPLTGYYPLNNAFVSPDINSFTADPTVVGSGGTTDLEWTVTGSVKEELWLDGEKVADITGQSPYTITPPEEPGEYTYTLKTYSSAGLISTKEVKITVTPGVSVESVQINDNNVEYRSNQRLEAVHTGLNPADGTLIYNWFVDRGSGSNTIADVIIPFDGNTVNDKSGNNNNGALHDDESDGFNSNGKYGVGYEFDGDNDYIEMPTIGNLFNSDFSYSIWVYIPSEPRTEDVSFFNVRNFDDTGTGDHRAGHIVLQPDDNIRFECKGEGDNLLLEKTKNLSITKDVYLHFVVIKRGNEFRFYYNGEEQPDMRITTSGSTAIDDNNISIGRLNSNTVTEYFKGRVDELMIFDRALSSGQIKSVYENGMRYIVPSETRVTDKWQVKVIPSNGTNTGEEKQSQQVTITASRRRLIVVETQ